MKRALSILLCLILLAGVSGFPAASADSLNVNSYYTLPESVTVDGVTITADGQITVTDEKLLSVLNDIDSAADWTSLTIDNAKLNVGGDINADGNRVIRGINGAEITIAGDVRAQALGYGTVISIVDGTSVEIGGSVFGNTDENNWSSRAIQAGNAYPENMRPSYVRVGKDVEGNVSAFGSELDIGGSVTGKVDAYAKSVVSVGKDIIGNLYASGAGTSVSVGNYVNGQIGASDHATVSIYGDVIDKVKAVQDNYVNIARAIVARNGATVTVDGNVSAINSDGSLGAGIEAESYPHGDYVPEGSHVEVTGNVQGEICANGGSTVNVQGYAEGDISAWNEGTLIVIGDYVKGRIDANSGSTVSVDGRVNGQVSASGNGTSVTIGDGVKRGSDELPYYYGNSAISTYDYANVTVLGDVVNQAAAGKDGAVARAAGMYASNGGTITVDGDVSAINSDGSLGTAVQAIVIPHPWIENEVLEGSHIEITGDVKGNVSANGGSSVDVHGHAEGRINASGESTNVTIGDYVKGDITANNGSTVDVQGHVDGHVHASGKGTHVTIGDGVSPIFPASMPSYVIPFAIDANNGAEVDVTGDVNGSIHTQLDSTVNVTGNVNGPIEAYLGSTVDVSGNAKQIYISNPTLSTGIPDDIDLGSAVLVGGDVSDGVFISMYGDGTDQSKLTVEGTINSKGNAITLNVQPHVVMDIPLPTHPWQGDYSDDDAYQKAMEEYQQAEAEYIARQRELRQQAVEQMNTGEGVQKIIDNLPQIIVGTLAPEADFVLVNGMMNQDNQKKITEALLSQINYIVNMEGVDTANIAVYGYEELDGYLVAREQQKLTVKCINDNMVIATVSAGRYATVDANGDGSYTITVQRGGDLNLVVTARPKGYGLSMNRSDSRQEAGTNSAYDEAQWGAWLSNLTADYAMRTLTLDLTEVFSTDIPYDTLRAYMVNYGIDTLLVITENAEYTMSIAEVLALAEDGATFTFAAREGALELAVNGTVVSTFSVE